MTRRGSKVIVTLGKEKINVVVKLKREQRNKDGKTLTVSQNKVTMF